MNEGLLSLTGLGLPYWMIFTLAILVILVPVITDMVRQKRLKKYERDNREVIDNLITNQESLYKNFTMLVDVLYDKYANNLTLEISKIMIELVYSRTKHCIIDKVQTIVYDEDRYTEGKLDIERVKSDIRIFISSKYFQDIMILNKLTCKGVKLSEHITAEINHKDVAAKVIALIESSQLRNKHRACKYIKHDMDAYFGVLINKAKSLIENKTT